MRLIPNDPNGVISIAQLNAVLLELQIQIAALQGNASGNAGILEPNEGIVPVGSIFTLAHEVLPKGYLLCDGRVYRKVDYPKLASLLGKTYGNAGEGFFKVPDYRGRSLRMSDTRRNDEAKDVGGMQNASMSGNEPQTATVLFVIKT